jgi:hypothetical protein
MESGQNNAKVGLLVRIRKENFEKLGRAIGMTLLIKQHDGQVGIVAIVSTILRML